LLKSNRNRETDHIIDGVPGRAGKIPLGFVDPNGHVIGKLLPAGIPKETIGISAMAQVNNHVCFDLI